jgi:DNA-binding protein Fis
MLKSRSNKPAPAPAAPVAVLLEAAERSAALAARLELAGFSVSVVATPEDARRAVERGADLCDGAALGEDLSRHSIEQLIRARLTLMLERLGVEQVADLYALVIREVERGLFALVLERCAGNKGEAARQLGLHRNTLRQKLAQLEATSGIAQKRSIKGARRRPRTSRRVG